MNNINWWSTGNKVEMNSIYDATFPPPAPEPPPHPGILKPMAGAPVHDDELCLIQLPIYGSPKIDGIRALTHDYLGPVTRKLSPIHNDHVRRLLADLPACLDGELVAINSGKIQSFTSAQSAIMKKTGTPNFRYLVFDYFKNPEYPYYKRYAELKKLDLPNYVKIIPHKLITNLDGVRKYAVQCISNGYEGAMLRHPKGLYKQGRSRIRQGWMLKIKNFQDAEGSIIGFKKSKTGNTLGSLHIRTEFGNMHVGAGLSENQRKTIWNNQGIYSGLTITFKYQPYGTERLPRFPVFKGFRYD